MKDGRVLKGQILAYDAQLGGISFRDIEGRVFNFSRDQYSYFVEKQRFPINKDKEIRPRKEEGIEITLGINVGYTSMREDLSNKEFYREASYGLSDLPISITAGIGTYLTRKHFVGLVADVGVFSFNPGFFNIGGKYKYEYDSGKSNVSKYIPLDLRFQQMSLTNSYSDYDYEFYNARSKFTTAAFSIGHGFGFIMKNGGSFNIELSYIKHFILSHKFTELPNDGPVPESNFALQGFRLGLSLSF
jgi:hypothetical protein